MQLMILATFLLSFDHFVDLYLDSGSQLSDLRFGTWCILVSDIWPEVMCMLNYPNNLCNQKFEVLLKWKTKLLLQALFFSLVAQLQGGHVFKFQPPVSNINVSKHEHCENNYGNLTASYNLHHQTEGQLRILTYNRGWALSASSVESKHGNN